MANHPGHATDRLIQVGAQVPPGYPTTKRRGEFAELAFMYKASSLGFGVAKPFGDSHPYDLLVQYGRRLHRIQVKSVFVTPGAKKRFVYRVHTAAHRYKHQASYSLDDIDFLVAYIAAHDAWYVVPVGALSQRKNINVYPGGKKRKDAGLYEIYREAWHLLKEEPPEEPKTCNVCNCPR
jgi:PD-(D/E)XK endonuclease